MTTVNSLSPRLIVVDAARAIDFYVRAFDATETERYTDPTGKIVHAEVVIDGISLTLKDEDPGTADLAPPSRGGTPVILTLDVDDADAVAGRMVEAGATVVYPISDQPEGYRGGRLADPFGHLWIIVQKLG